MQNQTNLSHERLQQLLSYDPATGLFTCRVNRRCKAMAGTIAGSLSSTGYVHLTIDRKPYLAHRLAWFYVHGSWPADQVDHRNEIKSDNRIENLRLASKAQNMLNTRIRSDNTSGVKGVSFTKRGKWVAYISKDGKRIHLGTYPEKADAESAVNSAREEFHGEFCNHGKNKRAQL